jgi:hypothetical protein
VAISENGSPAQSASRRSRCEVNRRPCIRNESEARVYGSAPAVLALVLCSRNLGTRNKRSDKITENSTCLILIKYTLVLVPYRPSTRDDIIRSDHTPSTHSSSFRRKADACVIANVGPLSRIRRGTGSNSRTAARHSPSNSIQRVMAECRAQCLEPSTRQARKQR